MSTGFLAQTSVSRLSEINKGSPRLFYASCRLGDQPCFKQVDVSLRKGESRLGENEQKAIVSVCRALVKAKGARLSETFLPKREAGRECGLFCCFSVLKCWLYVCIDLAFKL